ncbi:prenyltransferase [Pyruvatibacter sp.]|uniref:prenyltransferase n=1 Tax=Pyruvatibacter sp. TaxID=1981328 RepID=UPI0032EE0A2E
MTTPRLTKGTPIPDGLFDGAVARILELQRPDGSIPWYDGGVFDPWNHIEAAMALDVMGHRDEAVRAYQHLADTQLDEGSWWMEMGSAVPLDEDEQRYTGEQQEEKKYERDTNSAAYFATGIWHHYVLTDDMDFLRHFWPTIKAAFDFVTSHQSEHGDIRWASRNTDAPDDALITASSSIHKSLEHAAHIAAALGEENLARTWIASRDALGDALRNKPHRFDRTWEPKSHFSMDWYYPVLGGALTGAAARAKLASRWDEFVQEGMGCRCVVHEPWVTVAESAELCLALLGAGERERAEQMLAWQHNHRDEDGAYWMGIQTDVGKPWPAERPAWTAGAVILAADAVTQTTKAANVLIEHTLPDVSDVEAPQQRQRVHKR